MNSMENNIRTFKDFLEFYNLMSQTCFTHCVDNFKSRQLDSQEADCVEKCANKLIRFNNRSINVYADIQTKLMLKRQKEMEDQQKQLEAAQETIPVESNLPETSIDSSLLDTAELAEVE